MSDNQEIISSFLIRDTLNPKVWDNPGTPKKSKLKKNIFDMLVRIADEFTNFLGDDIFVDDVILVGSLVNFNWSKFSDFDLHIIIDFNQFGKQKELYKELLELKTDMFNRKHNIKIYGYDVELYSQPVEDEYVSSGVYSIMNNEWISVPEKKDFKIDTDLLKKKVSSWTKKIDTLIEKTKNDSEISKLKDKLKLYRKCGLDKKGELSYENLVFKYLRRSGHIKKLIDKKNELIDKKLSIETQIQH